MSEPVPTETKIAFQMREAAAVSGISRAKLYELIAEKKLKAVKVGGRRLILKRDLEALFEAAAA